VAHALLTSTSALWARLGEMLPIPGGSVPSPTPEIDSGSAGTAIALLIGGLLLLGGLRSKRETRPERTARSGTQPDVWRTHDQLVTRPATSNPLRHPPSPARLALPSRPARPSSDLGLPSSPPQFLGIVVELRRDVADRRWHRSSCNSRDRLGLRRYGN